MQGQLQDIDVCSLLQLVELGQRTGQLQIEAKGIVWLLSFSRGRLVHASPIQSQQERLQDFLHRLYPQLGSDTSFITDYPADSQSPHSQSIHHQPVEYAILCRLLEKQQLSRKQCEVLIQRLVEETLFDLLPLYEGSFQFHCDRPVDCGRSTVEAQARAIAQSTLASHSPTTQTIPIRRCVARVSHQIKSWNQLYPMVEHPEQYLFLRDVEQLSRQVEGSAFKQLTRWADGSLSLRQLSRRLNRSMTAVAQAIYPFLETKTIQLLSQSTVSSNPNNGSNTVYD